MSCNRAGSPATSERSSCCCVAAASPPEPGCACFTVTNGCRKMINGGNGIDGAELKSRDFCYLYQINNV